MFGLVFEDIPALSCAEIVEVQKQHNEKLDDLAGRLGKNTQIPRVKAVVARADVKVH